MFEEFKKYYNQTNDSTNLKNSVQARDGTLVMCPNCGSELPIQAKFCNHCGYNINENEMQQSEEIDSPEDKLNNKLEEHQNNINEILEKTKEEAAESAKSAAMKYEREIKKYDNKVKCVRNKSLKWLIKCAIISAILGLLSSIKFYGIAVLFKEEYGIPYIIKESIYELVRMLILWGVMFGLVWYNRHKSQNHWNLNVISAMYFSPILILVIWFYNKFMWMLGG